MTILPGTQFQQKPAVNRCRTRETLPAARSRSLSRLFSIVRDGQSTRVMPEESALNSIQILEDIPYVAVHIVLQRRNVRIGETRMSFCLDSAEECFIAVG